MDLDRIAVSPEIMLCKPVIRGTRVTVYPHLTRDDIKAAIAYAASTIGRKT
jgi:uncharacterized protein (DUF433 family)